MFFGFIGALVSAAVLFVADFLTEADLRQRKTKIRDTSRRLLGAQQELKALSRRRKLERKERERLRRDALIAYRTAQLELVRHGVSALEDAKRLSFTKLKCVQDRIHHRSGLSRSYIDQALFDQFHQLKAQVHEAIAESKLLGQALKNQESKLLSELKALGDEKTYGRLGAKKKLEKLLGELQADGRRQLASREAKDSTLRINGFSFLLEERCGDCKGFVSQSMAFCPLCGAPKKEREPIRYFKKDVGDNLACLECNAPALEEFAYCFNCGEEMDLLGLKAAL